MIRLLLTLPPIVLGLILEDGDEIVVRHDRDDSAYVALGGQYERGLVQLNLEAPGSPPDGHGTLIAPRWVLTAAHVAVEVEEGHELTVGSKKYAVERAILHPEWSGGATSDVGLIRLVTSVDGVQPIDLYRGTDEVGRTIVVVGRGDTGTGLTGPTGNDRKLRGATNRISGANESLLWFEFNSPEDSLVTELEGISGPGDSGNPAFLDLDGTLYIVGVGSSQSTSATGGREGIYGVTEYYVRVSNYIGWIDATMTEANSSPESLEDDGL
jgi:hypothetical protein